MDTAAVKAASITEGHPLYEQAVQLHGFTKKLNEREHAALLADQLCSAFCWKDTPEGHDYWAAVVRKLADLKQR